MILNNYVTCLFLEVPIFLLALVVIVVGCNRIVNVQSKCLPIYTGRKKQMGAHKIPLWKCPQFSDTNMRIHSAYIKENILDIPFISNCTSE